MSSVVAMHMHRSPQACHIAQDGRGAICFAAGRMLCWNPRKLWRCDPDIRPLREPVPSPAAERAPDALSHML